MPLLLAAGCECRVGDRPGPPTIAEQEDGVVARPEIVIDQRLRPTQASDRLLPAHRTKKHAARNRFEAVVFVQSLAKPFAQAVQAARAGDEDTELRDCGRHR